jgi:uncharacterized C2H2 Zn-finger protein
MSILLSLFCELCEKIMQFELVNETDLEEVYRCPVCGAEKRYTVR